MALPKPSFEFPLSTHVGTASQQPWVQLPDGAPAIRARCDAAKDWPMASLERSALAKAARENEPHMSHTLAGANHDPANCAEVGRP